MKNVLYVIIMIKVRINPATDLVTKENPRKIKLEPTY